MVSFPRSYEPGEPVLLRHVFRGVVRSAFPMRVVVAGPELLALWMPRGAVAAKLGGPDGLPTRDLLHATERIFVPSPCEQLHLVEPGRAHSVQARWVGADRRFQGWYVNLQEPLRASPLGWDSHDQQLDLLIGPGGLARWKDEDQFAEVASAGWYTAAQVEAIRHEGQLVLEQYRLGGPPFDQGWERWSPDPAWAIPELGPDWALLDPMAGLDVA
ncbi:MAG: DUF402 domain-containing protein [Actinomycetia bacterium]|nr:DUF402 domain-containing protein [Actinomycetes bacterium]